jgi:hypothetical protein
VRDTQMYVWAHAWPAKSEKRSAEVGAMVGDSGLGKRRYTEEVFKENREQHIYPYN